MSYASLAAVPATSALALLALWLLVSCPLVLLGTIAARARAKPFHPPTRVAQIPRQIPEKRWYLQHWAVIPLGGLLPFGSIFIETYFIFTSFWNYKFYYVYGFVLLVFSILLVVSSCVSIGTRSAKCPPRFLLLQLDEGSEAHAAPVDLLRQL
jgi:transmembrane 9 superfamily protein 3